MFSKKVFSVLAALVAAALLITLFVGISPVSAAASSEAESSTLKVQGPKTVVLICRANGKSAGLFPAHALPGKTRSGNFFAYAGPVEVGDDYSANCKEQLADMQALALLMGGTVGKDPATGVLVIVMPVTASPTGTGTPVVNGTPLPPTASPTGTGTPVVNGTPLPPTGTLIVTPTPIVNGAPSVTPSATPLVTATSAATFESNSNTLNSSAADNLVPLEQNPNLNGGVTGTDKKDEPKDNGSDKSAEWCLEHPQSANCKKK